MSELKISVPEKKIQDFCQENHITKLAFFGSVLTKNFRQDSDLDVLVEFDPSHIPSLFKIVNMESQLEQLFGRHVDLRTPKDLNSRFRNEVLDHAFLIYGKEKFQSF